MRYLITRLVIPFATLTGLLTLATIVYNPFASFLVVSCQVGIVAFLVALLLGLIGVIQMNVSDGPWASFGQTDSLDWKDMKVRSVMMVIAVSLVLWAFSCSLAMVIFCTGLS